MHHETDKNSFDLCQLIPSLKRERYTYEYIRRTTLRDFGLPCPCQHFINFYFILAYVYMFLLISDVIAAESLNIHIWKEECLRIYVLCISICSHSQF